MSKYRAKKCQVDGIKFDSLKEARRYQELRLLERAGKIADLRLQVPFFLIPAQRDENGNVVERAVKYIADFVYTGVYHKAQAYALGAQHCNQGGVNDEERDVKR